MKPIWWLSFADPDKPKGSQFLGVCVVRSDDMILAVQKTWELNINPGGEIHGVAIEDEKTIPIDCFNRLMQKTELIERGLARPVGS